VASVRKERETRERRLLFAAIAAVLVGVAMAPLASGGAGTTAVKGTLSLRAAFKIVSRDAFCPPGTSGAIMCHANNGTGVVPGIGTVSESYFYNSDTNPDAACLSAGGVYVLGYSARFIVLGKGEIELAVPGSTDCLTTTPTGTALNRTQPFTVTGGSGAYVSASGQGTVQHRWHYTNTGGAAGTDTWVGALIVPGLDFDVTAPILSGAVGKTVRAPRGVTRVRVIYSVTARDEVDGVVAVSCRPRSGSRFKIGRTVVSCSATDTSGNRGTTTFRVTVKARKLSRRSSRSRDRTDLDVAVEAYDALARTATGGRNRSFRS
jgi:HYR domain